MKYIFGGEEVKAWKFLTPSFQVIQKRFPALLKVHVQLFQFSLDVWQAKEGIVNLCKRQWRTKTAKLVTSVTIICLKKFFLTIKLTSNRPVTFVRHKRFTVLFHLPSRWKSSPFCYWERESIMFRDRERWITGLWAWCTLYCTSRFAIFLSTFLSSNYLKEFFMEMYGDHSGQFACGYWALKG